MKGDLHVRFREKFEVKVLLLTRLRGEKKNLPYSIRKGTGQNSIWDTLNFNWGRSKIGFYYVPN